MAWIEYNPNPRRNRVGDCAIRAIAKATDQDWEMAQTWINMQQALARRKSCWKLGELLENLSL